MKINAEFFDIFGIIAFLYIVIVSISGLLNNGFLPKSLNIILLLVGIVGLIVDVSIVVKTYLLKGKRKR